MELRFTATPIPAEIAAPDKAVIARGEAIHTYERQGTYPFSDQSNTPPSAGTLAGHALKVMRSRFPKLDDLTLRQAIGLKSREIGTFDAWRSRGTASRATRFINAESRGSAHPLMILDPTPLYQLASMNLRLTAFALAILFDRYNQGHPDNIFEKIFLPMSVVPAHGGIALGWSLRK